MIHFIYILLLSLGVVIGGPEKHTLVPENSLLSPLGEYDNGYPEERFDSVLQIVTQIYQPKITQLGGRFVIYKDWGDGAVNMWAGRSGNEYWLEIPGGMSRYYLINEEAFIVSICHELGHLLGGPPNRGDISFEGQSDYFAMQECSDLILSQVNPIKELPSEEEVEQLCSTNSMCTRGLQGALSLTSLYAKIESRKFPSLSTPSHVVVNDTLRTHPEAQCRLDTMKAGYFKEVRPRCWFAE